MSVSKAASKTPAITLITLLFILIASLSMAGEKNEKRGYLGVMLQDIDTNLAEAMDLDDANGVLVSEVIEDCPAEKAGLQDGDVIIKFQGENLDDYNALTKAVGTFSPGDEVEVVVLRDGKEKTLNVELGERSKNVFTFYSDDEDHNYTKFGHGDEDVFVWHNGGDDDLTIILKGMEGLHEDRGFMGVELDDINEQMGSYFEVKEGNGALITSVHEDSAAEKAGLQAGDIIVKMGDEDIESAADVHSAMSGTKPEEEMKIQIVRKGENQLKTLTLSDLPKNQLIQHFEMVNGDQSFTVRSPKMLFHGMPHAPKFPQGLHKEIRVITESEGEIDNMREELEKMKAELMEIREELKKK